MKDKLIALIHELILEKDKTNITGLKIQIMEKTAFLARPKDIAEIHSIMDAVNNYIDFPNENNKAKLEDIIERIKLKY